MTIKAKSSVREAFAGCSTGTDGTGHYETKGHAVNAFSSVLRGYSLHLDYNDLSDFHNNEGRKIVDVHDQFNEVIGRAVISWYRMPSGRYEFVGYLA